MKNINLIILFFFLINNFFSSKLFSEINNDIVVKVGNLIITSIDIQNEIITTLLINKRDITQENINSTKNYAIKNLINKSMKKEEVTKYEIEAYNKDDLNAYVERIAKNLNTNSAGLKKIFNQTNINYESFIENHEIELLWNTLIFKIYKNQTNVNVVDVENEVAKIKENKSNKEIEEIKKRVLNKKIEEKLSLFSRSHFSNLESSTLINFK